MFEEGRVALVANSAVGRNRAHDRSQVANGDVDFTAISSRDHQSVIVEWRYQIRLLTLRW